MPGKVNRCIAIAAHGRRCQQTAHGESPYCWHHSRARQRSGAPDAPRTAPPRSHAPEARLAALLGPEGSARLVAFLETGKPGRVRILAGPDRLGIMVTLDPKPAPVATDPPAA